MSQQATLAGEQPAIFEASLTFPDPDARRRLGRLVGLDDYKERLQKNLSVILDPEALTRWSKEQHGETLPLLSYFRRRPPLFMLVGDVGTGKTALAESIGDAVARSENISVTLYRLSLGSRGSGLVGDISRLVSAAFEQFSSAAAKAKQQGGKARAGFLLLIDEADALAQSRESAQMHHEDRVGVNALLRGIGDLAERELPAAVIMCTNRMAAIDPAVRRRAAEILVFNRPTEERRLEVLSASLESVGFTQQQLQQLARATGGSGDAPGYTYSDLTQRFLPSLIMDAYPNSKLKFERAIEIAKSTQPTPVFKDGAA